MKFTGNVVMLRHPLVGAGIGLHLAWFCLASLPGFSCAAEYSGTVVDAVNGRPIAGAIVTVASTNVLTREDGSFRIQGTGGQASFRAHGYARHRAALSTSDEPLWVALHSYTPRAVHLSLAGMSDAAVRDSVAMLPGSTRINALVIDVKQSTGEPVSFQVRQPAAERAGVAGEVIALIDRFRKEGKYTIARIPVFKDNFLVMARPDVALKADDGSIVLDNDGMAWADPRNRTVWDYNIAIAVEAARQGFDEIQFDFIRFPSVSSVPRIPEAERRAAIRGFLAAARSALVPYNVFVAADVFGYASWDPGDVNIGQKLEDMAAEVDYVCLMLYPSSFKRGVPSIRKPLDQPGKIVALGLKRAQQRTGLPANRFRPWLQAFRDYNFNRRAFGREEISAQTRAAEQFGSNGWMLYERHSIYAASDMPGAAIKLGRNAR